MPTRNVVITDHQARLIEELVVSGQYQNASEVLREGLRLVEERQSEHEAKLKALREAIDVGIADAEAGRYITFDDTEELSRYLSDITEKVLARRRQPSTRKK